ncbi:hypothetical protein GCM10027589_12600 [Actinocorallia lasiicapitis]
MAKSLREGSRPDRGSIKINDVRANNLTGFDVPVPIVRNLFPDRPWARLAAEEIVLGEPPRDCTARTSTGRCSCSANLVTTAPRRPDVGKWLVFGKGSADLLYRPR